MTVESIINSNSTAPLTHEEERCLIYNHYVVTSESPERVKNNANVIRAYFGRNIEALDTTKFDVTNSAFVEALLTMSFTSKLKILTKLHKLGYDIDMYDSTGIYKRIVDFPNASKLLDIYFETKRSKNIELAVSNETLVDLSPEERELVKNLIIENDTAFHKLPSLLIENEGFLTRYAKETNHKLSQCEIDIFTTDAYDSKLEEQLLNQFNCNSLDELLRLFIEQKQDCKSFSVLAALKVSTLKYLYEHGIHDVKLSFLSSDIMRENGVYIHDIRTINITEHAFKLGIEDFIIVLIHEAAHAIQAYNIDAMNFEDEPDLDLFTKDTFLNRNVQSYYDFNYPRIFCEFDADTKSKIYMMNLKGVSNELSKLLREYTIDQYIDTDLILDQVEDADVYYKFDLIRINAEENFKKYFLDDYVIKVINDQIKNTQNFEGYYAALKKDYPLLCYEFEITPNGAKKRTPKELVECAYYSEEKNDRKVYEYLIRSSATQRKCKNVNDNILEYTQIALDPNTPQEVVDLITENVITPSNGKYIEIFNTRNV